MNIASSTTPLRRAVAGLFLAGVTASGLVATPAEARDRPGTPNNEKAYACGNRLTQLPRICVEFYNTASERVTFETEVTRGGVPLAPGALTGRTECLGQKHTTVPSSQWRGRDPTTGGYLPVNPALLKPTHLCEAGHALGGGGSGAATEGRSGSGTDLDYIQPQGFIVKDVEPRVEYCFRFRARRVSDQVVSALWSNWTCAAGRDLPPKPSPPANVSAQYLVAKWVGNTPYPNRVELKWSTSANAGYFTVRGQTHPYGEWVNVYPDAEWTKSYPGGKSEYADTVIVPPEVVAAGGNPVEFCAYNIVGKACTRSLVSRLLDQTTHALGTQNGAVEALRQPQRLRVTTQPLPAPGRTDSPLPVATSPKLGILGMPSTGTSVIRAQAKVLQQTTATQPPVAPAVPAIESPAAQRGSTGASVLRATLPVSTAPQVARVPAAPGTCKPGYVWRVTRPSDLVCVTPQSRARVADENRLAASRVQPGGGAYGPSTCRPGLVWREAFAGDVVCVAPEVRAAVREENLLASSRTL